MGKGENLQPKTGEYAHKTEEVLLRSGYLTRLGGGDSALALRYFEDLNEIYRRRLKSGKDAKFYAKYKDSQDKWAVQQLIDIYKFTIYSPTEIVSSLLYPDAEQRFGKVYPVLLTDEARSRFEQCKDVLDVVKGWSEDTKRHALLQGLVSRIAQLDGENIDYELAQGTRSAHPGLLRRNKNEIQTCTLLKEQLLERR